MDQSKITADEFFSEVGVSLHIQTLVIAVVMILGVSLVGGNVTVIPGVTIGNRCIVAAGSVVTRDVPDDCLVAGNPAVIKKKLNQ